MKTSLLPAGLTLVGEIEGRGDLVIAGVVEGPIELEGTLTIDEGGEVRGDVSATALVVRGVLVGSAAAKESIRVEPSATLVGDARAPRVNIVEGARVRGRVQMTGETPPEPLRRRRSRRRPEDERGLPAPGAPAAREAARVERPRREEPARPEPARTQARPEARRRDEPAVRPEAPRAERARRDEAPRAERAPAVRGEAPEAPPSVPRTPRREEPAIRPEAPRAERVTEPRAAAARPPDAREPARREPQREGREEPSAALEARAEETGPRRKRRRGRRPPPPQIPNVQRQKARRKDVVGTPDTA